MKARVKELERHGGTLQATNMMDSPTDLQHSIQDLALWDIHTLHKMHNLYAICFFRTITAITPTVLRALIGKRNCPHRQR